MSGRRARLRGDFREARSRMVVARPIPPIEDHYFEADRQDVTGCLTLHAFVRSWRAVRRERKGGHGIERP